MISCTDVLSSVARLGAVARLQVRPPGASRQTSDVSLRTLQWVQELPLRDDPSPTAVCRELYENGSITATVLLSDAMDTIYLLDRERRGDGHILIHSLHHQGDHVFVRRLRQTRQTNRVPSRILLEIVLLLFEDGDLFLERIDLCLSLLHNSSQSR